MICSFVGGTYDVQLFLSSSFLNTLSHVIPVSLNVTVLFVVHTLLPLPPQLTSVYPAHLTRLYEKMLRVSEKGHQKATEKVAYAMLFGDYMNQNITKAKEMFEKLAVDGSPKAQMVHHFKL